MDAITPKEGLRSCNPMVVDDAGQAVRRVGTGQDITKHTREQLVPFEATYAPDTWTSTTCTPQESVVKGINTGVFDGSTGEVTEFTTFFAKGNMETELGRIIVSGAFDLSAGVGKSRYRGHICF